MAKASQSMLLYLSLGISILLAGFDSSRALADELFPIEIGGVPFSIDLRGGFYLEAEQLGDHGSFRKPSGSPTADDRAKLNWGTGIGAPLSVSRVGFNVQGDCYSLAEQEAFCEYTEPDQRKPMIILGFDVSGLPRTTVLNDLFASVRPISKPGDPWSVSVLTGKSEDGLDCFPKLSSNCDYYVLVEGRMLARVGLIIRNRSPEVVSSIEQSMLALIRFYLK